MNTSATATATKTPVVRTAEQVNILYDIDIISMGFSFREKVKVFFDRDNKPKRILDLMGKEVFATNAW